MKSPAELQSLEDVLEWLRETMELTPFGTVGIEIKMHDGKPVSVQPLWRPILRILEQKLNEKTR